ncbi:hypothetical protein [uncultured Chryseobacterium sp.]|uniref:lipopolysaccharide biosynthesis protein n=1 Tax=uncultured Chryseobacterium sp. TaxID=259322 RepID=UPI0025E86633|nr:hypothetical protein [uncultured Chryseobacterium sp.]
MHFVKKINSASIYLVSRYFIYGIQFFNSLLIALYLGPFYLGIWGFFNLILQYTEQLNLGIANASNVFLSIGKTQKRYNSYLIGNSIIQLSLFALVVVGILFTVFYFLNIGKEYNIKGFFFPIIIITFTTYINSLLLNIMRVYDKIILIIISQAFYPLLTLVVLLTVKKEILLESLVYCYMFSNLILTALFLYKNPIKIRYNFNKDLFHVILNKAIPLFLYNCFFYLIMISTRTAVSLNYNVAEFGIFTFTFSLSSIVLLLFESITFLIWPKLIHRFSIAKNEDAKAILTKTREVYLVSSHFLMYAALLFYPLFVLFFEKYQNSYKAFGFNLLTVMVLNAAFGFQPFIISKSKQKFLSYLSFFCFILNIIISCLIILVFHLTFEYVIIASMISYLVFTLGSGLYTYNAIEETQTTTKIQYILPFRIFLPFTLVILFLVFNIYDMYLVFLVFSLFLFLNYSKVINIKILIGKIFTQPDFFKI